MATHAEVLLFQDNNQPIVFYQHWDGSEIAYLVARALKEAEKKGFIEDAPIVASYIFQEMLRFGGKEGIFSISHEREQCYNTVEIYHDAAAKPEIVVDSEFYTYDDFMSHFASKKTASA